MNKLSLCAKLYTFEFEYRNRRQFKDDPNLLRKLAIMRAAFRDIDK